MDNLYSLIISNGGFIHPSLSVSGQGPQRGLYTSEQIPAQTSLIKLPLDLVLKRGNSNISQVACFLEEFNNISSKWKPYFDTLPPVRNHPALRTTEYEMTEAKSLCPSAYDAIEQVRSELNRVLNKLSDQFTREQIENAFLWTITRNWQGLGALPLIDMINHGPQLAVIVKREHYIELLSVAAIGIGPVTTYYQTVGPAIMYAIYDVPPSEVDWLDLRFKLPLTDLVRKVLQKRHIKSEQDEITLLFTHKGVTNQAYSVARILAMDPASLTNIVEENEVQADLFTEQRAHVFLITLLQKIRIFHSNENPNVFVAIQARMNQIIDTCIKYLHHQWLRFVDPKIDQLIERLQTSLPSAHSNQI